MKKFNKFGFASAIVLAGAMGFAACSSDDEEFVELNPTFDGNSVKTQFAISLTQKANKGGRMTANQAQEDNQFGGMKNLVLYPAATVAGGAFVATHAINYAPIKLADIATADLKANTNSTVYENVAFALGTNHFLFYAESKGSTEGALSASHFDGSGNLKTLTNYNNITFDLVSVYTANTEKEKAVLDAINAVDTALTSAGNLGDAEANNDDDTYKALRSTLRSGGAVIPGSSNSVKAFIEDVYVAVKAYDPNSSVLSTIERIFTVSSDKLTWMTDPAYPFVAGLPDGAVGIKFDNTQAKFIAATPSVDGMSVAAPANYVKPAALYYRASSAAGVKDAPYLKNATDATWAELKGKYTQGAVQANTQSVILMDQVQYAVADLVTTVMLSDATLKDSKGNNVTASGFPVSAILVGGQGQVGWNFEPTGDKTKTIYDAVYGRTLSTRASEAVHTLVLETNETNVRFALELTNNGNDFYGANGCVVPTGSKFYLVGEIDVTKATSSGSTAATKVFQQDYQTLVGVQISTLAKAYNVIPDLKAPEMEFGLSVDLSWKTGLEFNVDITNP